MQGVTREGGGAVGILKARFLGLAPRDSDSLSVGWTLRSAFLTNNPGGAQERPVPRNRVWITHQAPSRPELGKVIQDLSAPGLTHLCRIPLVQVDAAGWERPGATSTHSLVFPNGSPWFFYTVLQLGVGEKEEFPLYLFI